MTTDRPPSNRHPRRSRMHPSTTQHPSSLSLPRSNQCNFLLLVSSRIPLSALRYLSSSPSLFPSPPLSLTGATLSSSSIPPFLSLPFPPHLFPKLESEDSCLSLFLTFLFEVIHSSGILHLLYAATAARCLGYLDFKTVSDVYVCNVRECIHACVHVYLAITLLGISPLF